MKWIELKEGNPLPDYDEPALWIFEDGTMTVDSLEKDGNPWLFGGWGIDRSATHWMPLPPIPDASLPSSSVTGEEDKDLIPDEIYKDIADFFKYSKYRGPYTIQKYGGSMIVKFMDGSKAKCSIQMWQGEEVVLDDQPTTPVTGESEAIGFAEWAGSSYSYAGDNIWEGDDDDTITTSELYNLYKQSKK